MTTKKAGEPAPTPAPKRSFLFDASFSVPVPEIKATPRSNELPFKRLFTEVQDQALTGKDPHFFIPHAYWVEERAVEKAKATDGYASGKLRDQFNKWKKESIARDPLHLVVLPRTGKEPGFTEPGVSIWITKPAAKKT